MSITISESAGIVVKKKKPTEAEKAAMWSHCEICHEQSPFLVEREHMKICVPCDGKRIPSATARGLSTL